MYYPLVGEHVWLSGSRREFVVAQTDGIARVATISAMEDRGAFQKRAPFLHLFAYGDFDAAQVGGTDSCSVLEMLRSSRVCVDQARIYMQELRASIANTGAAIHCSQALIAQSDLVIRRLRAFGCHHDQHEASNGAPLVPNRA